MCDRLAIRLLTNKNKNAVASRPTAGRLVRGLSDRLSVGSTTREYIPARKIPYMEEIYL